MRKIVFYLLLVSLLLSGLALNASADAQCTGGNGNPCVASYVYAINANGEASGSGEGDGAEPGLYVSYCVGNGVKVFWCDTAITSGYNFNPSISCGLAGDAKNTPETVSITITRLDGSTKTVNACRCRADSDYCTGQATGSTTTSSTNTPGTNASNQSSGGGNEGGVLDQIKTAVYTILITLYCIVLYVASAVAALFIILTGVKYMLSEDESGRVESRRRLTYALVGLMFVALACPLINMLFSGSDIGVPDSTGKKVPCPGCPLIPGGTNGILGGGGITPNPTPSNPTKTCAEQGGLCCQSGEIGRGTRYTATDCTVCFDICETSSNQNTKYGSCAAACKDAKNTAGNLIGYSSGNCKSACTASSEDEVSSFTCSGTDKCCCTPKGGSSTPTTCDAACKAQTDTSGNPKYTGGQCVQTCDTANNNEVYNQFDCTKEGKPAGNTCCCAIKTVAPHSLNWGAACQHSIECVSGYYCGGGFPNWKCIPNAGENVNCNPDQEVDGKFILICQSSLFCKTTVVNGVEFKSCQKPTNTQSCIGSGGHCCDMSITGTTCDTEIPLTKDMWTEPECAGDNVKCCTVCRS